MALVPETGVREHRAPVRVEALQPVQLIEDLEIRDALRDVVVAVPDPDREFMVSGMAQELAVQHLQVGAAPAKAVGGRMKADEPAAASHELQQSGLPRTAQLIVAPGRVDDDRRIVRAGQRRERVEIAGHLELVATIGGQVLADQPSG